MKKIESLKNLAELCKYAEHVKLYGAGLRLASFMDMVKEAGIPLHVECILVSSARGNPTTAFGIPIIEAAEAVYHDTDVILLTISDCFTEDVEKTLSDYGMEENVYEIDYTIIDEIPYNNVYQSVENFVRECLWREGKFNLPVRMDKKYVWSCWWQGEEAAPEVVKKCWESQRRNLPVGAEHVIITWDNYRDYVELPIHVTEKAERGLIIPAHLADMVRCCLLYKYGGIWLDATVYVTEHLPEAYFDYEILSRSTGEKIYCTKVSWVTWFLAGKKGEELYRFIMEAFFYYLRDHDEIVNYYMIDFLIAIACNEIAGIEHKMRKIPVNNVSAVQLQKYLGEEYSPELCRACTAGSVLQKLTYKGKNYQKNSIFNYLVNAEIEK